jgi:hypothetical protein
MVPARFFALLGLLLGWALPVGAQQALSDADRSAIREIIRHQEDAFRRDDGPAAFGDSSAAIQGLFGSAETFMNMVRQGYQPVYRPRRFEFGEIVDLGGQPTQQVDVIGPDGKRVQAFYPMTRLPDGTWRINGCYLKASESPEA